MQEKGIEQTIKDFMETKPPVIDIIGYGSAVKIQSGYKNDTKKQIDIIATVSDSLTWHKQNKQMNTNQYNKLAMHLLRPILHLGTDISYISNIPYDDNFFKVGVIDKFDFLYDLENWSNFYMAGRTQKPIMIVTGDEKIENAIAKNRVNALITSLILNSDKVIDEKKLFETLCSLSYLGDVRMALKFENPNKVGNIVSAELDEFKNTYSELNDDLYYTSNGIIVPNTDKLLQEVSNMPSNLVNYLTANNISIDNLSVENLNKLKEYIIKYIKKINLKSSIAQPLKSASINNTQSSIRYLKEKRKKYIVNK